MPDNSDVNQRMKDEALNTPHTGTSVFSHVDDAGADVHMSTIEGAKHHFYGEPMTPKHQLEETILGPAPFGSPDPHTLGHQMIPLEDGPASAAELDADFLKIQRGNFAGRSEQNMDDMTKEELLDHAKQLGVEGVRKSDSKTDIRAAIEEHQSNQQQGNQEGQQQGQGNQGENEGNEDQQGSYSGMSKAELLEEAQRRQLPVNETNSKQEILEALEDPDNQQNTQQQ